MEYDHPMIARASIALTALLLAASGVTAGQDASTFKRIYTAGEKRSYSIDIDQKDKAGTTTSVDLDLTVAKVQDTGVDLAVHFSNLQSVEVAGKVSEDRTVPMGPHNLPLNATFQDRTTEAALPFFFLAGATSDKAAKAGDETPIQWKCNLMGFDGSVKVLSISNGRIKSLVKAKVQIQGIEVGDIAFTSDESLPGCALIDSVGALTFSARFGGSSLVEEFKITQRK